MKDESADREPAPGSGASRRTEPGQRIGPSQAIVLSGAVLLAAAAWRADLASRPAVDRQQDAAAVELRIDLNAASVEELMLLPGIGVSLAERIVEHRQTRGPFESLEDLAEVHGIGPAKIATAAEYLQVP